MVDFITNDKSIFRKYSKYSICGHESETMWCMELTIGMSDKHHRYSKYIKFRQNPRESLVIGHGMTLKNIPEVYIDSCCKISFTLFKTNCEYQGLMSDSLTQPHQVSFVLCYKKRGKTNIII